MRKHLHLTLCVVSTVLSLFFFVRLVAGEVTVNNVVFLTIFSMASVASSHSYSESRHGGVRKIS